MIIATLSLLRGRFLYIYSHDNLIKYHFPDFIDAETEAMEL
jgi:hypothetical protein